MRILKINMNQNSCLTSALDRYDIFDNICLFFTFFMYEYLHISEIITHTQPGKLQKIYFTNKYSRSRQHKGMSLSNDILLCSLIFLSGQPGNRKKYKTSINPFKK
jgi:hypothetical protein